MFGGVFWHTFGSNQSWIKYDKTESTDTHDKGMGIPAGLKTTHDFILTASEHEMAKQLLTITVLMCACSTSLTAHELSKPWGQLQNVFYNALLIAALTTSSAAHEFSEPQGNPPLDFHLDHIFSCPRTQRAVGSL